MKRQSIILALLAPAFLAQGNVLINETWLDGERVTQDIGSNSMAWYSSSGSANVTIGVGNLTQNTGGSGRHIVASFTDPGSPVNLAVGDSLQVRFVVSFNRATPLGSGNDFRMGAWNSQGLRVDADNHNGTSATNPNPAFENYTGYIFAGGLDASRSISLRRKDAGTAGVLISSTSVYQTLGSTTSGTHTTIDPNVDYTGTFTLDHTASELVISYSMDLGPTNYTSITRTDSSSPHLVFDTVAFLVGSNVADGFSLKQVEVTYTPVPEPAAAAALLGGIGFIMVVMARRFRRKE